MAWSGVITNAGAAMLATYAQGGHTMTIDSAVVGSGNTPSANMRSATTLAAQEDTAAITGTSAEGANVQIRVQVSASEDGGYAAKEIGLYAHLDNGTSQLMALYQDPTGVSVPDISVNPDYAFGLYIAIAISNTDDLTVEVDTSAVVSIGEMADALALKVDKTVYEAAIAGKVSKSGDAMNGTLEMTGAGNVFQRKLNFAVGANYGGPVFKIVDINGRNVGNISISTADNHMSFRLNPIDNEGIDIIYWLPIPPAGQTANKSYDILTTQAAVAIAQGGTGASTPAAALANLGAVDKAGDTMTGVLTNNSGFRVNRASGYGGLSVQNNGNSAFSFFGDTVTHRPQVEVYDLANSGHGDRYMFPVAENSLAADAYYALLTTKSAVTVAQGGTGATTKADARANLGVNIQHGTKSVGTSATTVTFSKEFPAAPNVVATGSVSGNVWITNITKSGFTVQSSVANNSVKWQAIYIS